MKSKYPLSCLLVLKLFIALLAANLAARPASVQAQDWPQFRGPNGNGVANEAKPPLEWSETNNVAWKVSPPGRGRSSPVILGDRIYLTTALERGVQRVTIKGDDMQKAEHVSLGAVCLDRRDGKLLWQVTLYEIDSPPPVHWQNSWATPTPVIEAGKLYCDFGTFGTVCLDAQNGKELWKASLPADHMVGPGSSPALWRDLLLLVRDGIDTQYVAAVNKETGRTVWKTERPPLTGGNQLRKAFSTPFIVTTAAGPQAVIPCAQWVVSYEPATGKELWRVQHGKGFSFGTEPVSGNGLVYVGTGMFHPQIWAIRPEGQGDVTQTHVAWKSDNKAPDMSSPVLVGNEIYWVSDSGGACCSDGKTGEVLWQKLIAGTYLASPISASGRVYFFERSGKTTVFKAGREMEQLAQSTLPGPLIATPAFVGLAIYLRTDEALYCIRESPQRTGTAQNESHETPARNDPRIVSNIRPPSQ
jgi:outer membrane protein assembly factor BamB